MSASCKPKKWWRNGGFLRREYLKWREHWTEYLKMEGLGVDTCLSRSMSFGVLTFND